MQLLYQAWRCA